MERILALIDGEHYLPVTKEAIEKLNSVPNQVVAAMFLGGTETIGDFDEVKNYLNLPLYFLDQKSNFQKIIQEIKNKFKITTIFDLSDDPVISSQDRMDFTCVTLLEGCNYNGADFQFTPINFLKSNKPVINVIGSAKRVGKTAAAGYIARVINQIERITPCILTMGRGGPEIPEVIRGDQLTITAESLIEVAEQGKHAASDYWEDALTSRVITVGCRRCAGGLAGSPYLDNVEEGIKIAENQPVDLIIAEGSGPTIPPVMGDTSIIDTPELWLDKSIDDIVDFRSQLVRGKFMVDVSDVENPHRVVEYTRELALSKNSVFADALFEKKPYGRIAFYDEIQPHGPSAPLKMLDITNPKYEQNIEKNN